ncbi:MAG: hypothetical protein FWD66_05595 [Paludibacter sp.]|nr:hypothetical protein [Paludibacter sp.]
MRKTVVKYLVIFIFLLVFINRGVFVTPYEIENTDNKEINSIIELVIQFVTGGSNNIDEDGNNQTDCNSVRIVHYDFFQQLTQSFEFANLFPKEIKINTFPNKLNFTIQGFRNQIDHPPKIV